MEGVIVTKYLIAILVSLCLLFGYLSYTFYSDKAVAESKLESLQEANKSLEDSLTKAKAVVEITDQTSTEYLVEKQELVREKDSYLNDLSKLTQVPTKAVNVENKAVYKGNNYTNEKVVDGQNTYADLDSELPPSLVSLLNEVCDKSRGSACTHH